jgi:hypothetical protein
MIGANGGLIGAYRSPRFSSAPGMWTPQEQCVAQLRKTWQAIATPTYSQSSLYSGTTAASLANMTNGSFTDTATATNSSGSEWVKVDYGQLVRMEAAVIGTATSNIPGGWNRTYTEGRVVQVSTDDSTWTTVCNIGTFPADGIYTFYFAPTDARYMRAFSNGSFFAISELYAL